jgi:hypothetical protein
MKTIAPGSVMMGFTVMVRVVSHAPPPNVRSGNTAQPVPVFKILFASAAAISPVTPLILGVAFPSTKTIVPTNAIRVFS